MAIQDSTAEETARREQERVRAHGMQLLTGGLTTQGSVFLIAVAAVFLMVVLYPVIGAWSLLAFPAVFTAAVLIRRKLNG